MEGNDRRHHTILTEGEEPVPLQSARSPFYQCPFCSYKTAERHSVIYHIKNHATVKHKEFTIARCGLKCRSTTHFHCCYYPATLISRDQITKHLSSHIVLDNTITGTLQTPVAPPTVKTPQGHLQTPVALPKEWQDGIHNFDNHMMLSLHLCLALRNALQTHTAVSRVIGIIEATEGESFPNKETVLQAYLSFEALSEHDYTYACVSCPATVVMDLHKKGVFSMPVSEIQIPPQQYDSRVNVKDFWDAVTMEILSCGFYPSDGKNPFIVRPSYQNWAPWIGQHTRQSDIVFNTEYAKIHVPDVSTDADERVTEERLVDEVLNLKILNSCLKVIEKLANDQGIKVFSVNSYVVHTWFIPMLQNPEQHLPDKADDFRALDNMSLGQPVRHYSTVGGSAVFKNKLLCLCHLDPGENSVQTTFNMLDFSELDMEHLRRWWCMLLIDNFPVTFEGRRSTKRRLEREDCEDSPRVSNHDDPPKRSRKGNGILQRLWMGIKRTHWQVEILVSSEEEDGEKQPFISSAMAASQWCSAKKMGDKVILPQILSMAPLDREAALHNLGEASNLRDEDSWEDRMDQFMFRFKFESDYLMFFEQCIDKENLKVHGCFEERG
ncbi:hypothetical protein JOQ06_023445 [Pogonophryne albipinna]|uniref:C2H2-type domain-containing protein n=1 Tax=Pogonophryne albipinna TaxID=1090488 RepID=A0AAD6FTW4_9TELE|nr:hypothetical protein JOQ06_023445 [Pogonophryne albipinna]